MSIQTASTTTTTIPTGRPTLEDGSEQIGRRMERKGSLNGPTAVDQLTPLPLLPGRRSDALHWRRDSSVWRGRMEPALQRLDLFGGAQQQQQRRFTTTSSGQQPQRAPSAKSATSDYHSIGSPTSATPNLLTGGTAVAWWWCPKCDTIACPLDPRQREQFEQSTDSRSSSRMRTGEVELIMKMSSEKTEMARKLEELQALLDATIWRQKESAKEKEELQRRLNDREHTNKMLEKELNSTVKDISRLHAVQSQLAEELEEKKQLINSLQPDLASSGANGSGNDVELTVLRQTVEELSEEIRRLRDSKDALKSRLVDAEEATESLQKQLGDRWTSRDRVDDRDEMRGRRSASGQRQTSDDGGAMLLLTKLAGESTESNTLLGSKDVSSSVAGEILLLRTKLRESEKRLEDLEESKQEEINELHQQLCRVENELASTRTSRDQIETQLREADNRNAETVKDFETRWQSTFAARPANFAADADSRRSVKLPAEERTFRKFVALQRELNEAREINDKLRDELAAVTLAAQMAATATGSKKSVSKNCSEVAKHRSAIALLNQNGRLQAATLIGDGSTLVTSASSVKHHIRPNSSRALAINDLHS